MEAFNKSNIEPPDKNTRSNRSVPIELPKDYQPGRFDVLCGRGKGCSNHEGNKIFSSAVREKVRHYENAKKRADKSVVVASTFSWLKDHGARFIKFDKRTQRWYDIGDEQARDKTGHAIRDFLANERNIFESRRKRKRAGGRPDVKKTAAGLRPYDIASESNTFTLPLQQNEMTKTDFPVCGSRLGGNVGSSIVGSYLGTPLAPACNDSITSYIQQRSPAVYLKIDHSHEGNKQHSSLLAKKQPSYTRKESHCHQDGEAKIVSDTAPIHYARSKAEDDIRIRYQQDNQNGESPPVKSDLDCSPIGHQSFDSNDPAPFCDRLTSSIGNALPRSQDYDSSVGEVHEEDKPLRNPSTDHDDSGGVEEERAKLSTRNDIWPDDWL
jgi:hypothetical protein